MVSSTATVQPKRTGTHKKIDPQSKQSIKSIHIPRSTPSPSSVRVLLEKGGLVLVAVLCVVLRSITGFDVIAHQ